MHPLRKKRLIWILIIVVLLSGATALALFALRQNINLFFTPIQVIKNEAPLNHPIRLGGWVVPGSIHHHNDTLNVSFLLTDHKASCEVIYEGILPDLFREGQAIVAEGSLNAEHQLIATEVLAKHDENYTPPPLKDLPK